MRYGSWRALVGSVLCLALGAALSGCGAGDPRPAPRPPDQSAMLHRSMLQDQHLRAAGLDPEQDTGGVPNGQVDADPGRPCDGRLRSDVHRRLTLQSGYSLETVQVVQHSFSYQHVPAAEVVAQIRETAKRCDTYQARSKRGEVTYTVDPTVRLPAVDGVDAAYAYCETGRTEQVKWWICHAALARGRVISTLRVNAATKRQTRTVLAELAPVAAQLLVRATRQP